MDGRAEAGGGTGVSSSFRLGTMSPGNAKSLTTGSGNNLIVSKHFSRVEDGPVMIVPLT
jgi:hypothetical protein